jgi:hypothetical protein
VSHQDCILPRSRSKPLGKVSLRLELGHDFFQVFEAVGDFDGESSQRAFIFSDLVREVSSHHAGPATLLDRGRP